MLKKSKIEHNSSTLVKIGYDVLNQLDDLLIRYFTQVRLVKIPYFFYQNNIISRVFKKKYQNLNWLESTR
jgi:hypothetical protein